MTLAPADLPRRQEAPARSVSMAEAGAVVVGNVAALLAGFVLLRLLTTYLSPSEYGIYALALATTALVQQVMAGPLSQAVARHYALAYESGTVPSLIKAGTRLVFRSAAVLAVVCAAVSATAAAKAGMTGAALVAAVGLYTIAANFHTTLEAFLGAARRRSAIACHQVVLQAGRVGCATAIGIFAGWSAAAILAALAFAYIPAVMMQIWRVRDLLGQARASARLDSCSHVSTADLTTFAKPFLLWGFFTWLHLASDRWSLAFAEHHTAVGYYNAIYYVICYPVALVSGGVMQTLVPYLYQVAGDGLCPKQMREATNYVIRLSTLMLASTAVGAGLLVVLHPVLARLCLGPAFQPASPLMPVAFAAAGLFATGQAMSLIQSVEKTPGSLVVPKITTAIVGVAANLAGALAAGVQGVFIATGGTAVMYLVSVAYINRNALKSALQPVIEEAVT